MVGHLLMRKLPAEPLVSAMLALELELRPRQVLGEHNVDVGAAC